METALPFKKFLTEECFAQISNIAKESICEQYSQYYNHLQEEDKHAHSVVLVVNHHTVGPQGHQQIMVCALEREEEQRECQYFNNMWYQCSFTLHNLFPLKTNVF